MVPAASASLIPADTSQRPRAHLGFKKQLQLVGISKCEPGLRKQRRSNLIVLKYDKGQPKDLGGLTSDGGNANRRASVPGRDTTFGEAALTRRQSALGLRERIKTFDVWPLHSIRTGSRSVFCKRETIKRPCTRKEPRKRNGDARDEMRKTRCER